MRNPKLLLPFSCEVLSPEYLEEGAGLQQMFCCLLASTTRALLCMADEEFRIQVMAETVLACPEPEHVLDG